MQLNKYLALCGVASRRKATGIIMEGRVAVNGKVVREMGREVIPRIDLVVLDGQEVSPPGKRWYILLNKPGQSITTMKDTRGRRTVMDLVHVDERVFPVGRLDYDTEGVLLLTNDGDLANRLAHPRYTIDKVYQAWVDGNVKTSDIKKLEAGVAIDDGVVVSGEVKILRQEDTRSLLEIRIHEGKKRQIKRMMKAVHHPVQHLVRTRFAGLEAGNLVPGEWRELQTKEVNDLYALCGLERYTEEQAETTG
jgi:23S rRNA pseudouridine2605 synthase